MKTEWIGVDPRGLRTQALECDPGPRRTTTRELPSPYDVPEGLKVTIDEDTHSVEIQFIYAGESEPLVTAVSDREVQIQIGRHSRRIHYLRLDGERIPGSRPIGDPLKALIEAIDKLIETTVYSSPDARACANYVIARAAVQENAHKAISSATARSSYGHRSSAV